MASYNPVYVEFDHSDTPSAAVSFTLRLKRNSDHVQVQGNTIPLTDSSLIRIGDHFRVNLLAACFSPESAAAYNVPENTDLYFEVTAQNAAGQSSPVAVQNQPFQFTDAVAPVVGILVS